MAKFKALLHPLLTEKSFELMEKGNKLVFVVDKKATKPQIKEEIEAQYEVEVESVKIINEFAQGKKAYIKLKPDYDAGKIIGDMGLM